jgi:hypothetical protein
MAVAVTVRLGAPPHPSFVMVEQEWFEDLTTEHLAEYVRLTVMGEGSEPGEDLGVLRVLDSGWRSQANVYIDPRAWIKRVPAANETVELDVSDALAYKTWRKWHTRGRRRLFWLSLALTVAASCIEASWSIGKYWDWLHPNDALAGLSQLAKWVFLALGVGGIAAYKDYRTIE